MTFRIIQPLERDEYDLLKLMTHDTRKFAIAIGYPLTELQQTALERLQLKDWIRLIDVSQVAAFPQLPPMRIFRVMPEAVAWYEAQP